MSIQSITFVHDGTRYACTVGAFITKETPRPAKTKRETQRLNDYMGPVKSVQAVMVTKIADSGDVYLVHLDPSQDSHGWANPFMVGKRDAVRVS